jgi:hypothetical protein
MASKVAANDHGTAVTLGSFTIINIFQRVYKQYARGLGLNSSVPSLYTLGSWGRGSENEHSLYTVENVDNCECPLTKHHVR